MRFVTYAEAGQNTLEPPRLALRHAGELLALPQSQRHRAGGSLLDLVRTGVGAMRETEALLRQYGRPLDESTITFLPPIPTPPKIICVGLNYLNHVAESRFELPDYPTLFGRFATSLTGHLQPIIRPLCSEQLDYEGEMVVFIGRGGRHISRAAALDHVIGYAVGNEATIRDYQYKSVQWTVGKNFDGTGAIGPCFVSADEVPAGGKGLRLVTRLNGETMQSASTSEMLFDVASLIAAVSEAMTLEPGDMFITGTPAGVGGARKPQRWMKHGDVCEVEIEGLGLLRNPVASED